MKHLRLIIPLIIFIMGCTASQKTLSEKPEMQEKKSIYDESFDPLSLKDDDIVISNVEEAKKEELKPDQKKILIEEKTVIEKEVDGYRVQLLATRSIESATLIKQKAEEQFQSYNHKVYWSFEAPFYKIRIGNVLKRTEAEAIRDLAKKLGYDQAFPVRSKVFPPDNQM